MLLRLSLFVLAQAALGLLGWWWLRWPGALLGVLAGGAAIMVADTWRADRYLNWLKNPDTARLPALRGPWGEAAWRSSRALRAAHKQAQDSAQRLQDFLAAVQASPNGVVLLDADGRIDWCNHIASQHFGIDPRRDLLQHVGNLVREPAFTAYYAAGNYTHGITMLGRGDAPGRPAKLSVQLFPYGGGHMLLLSSDITAIAQADAMRRDFVANVSHEIRTPLTVLAGFVETLQTLPLDEAERNRYLGLMATQAQRLQTLVNDLLALSRLEGSPPPGAHQGVNLPDLLAQCAEEARALSHLLYGSDAQQLALNPAVGFDVAGNASEIRSAISNLLNNAVRYTPVGGRVQLLLERLPDGRARIAVQDSGPGIAPEHIPRLGERFYRVDRSRSRESGGTGLGLAIAKHVASRHGGELRIDSQLGQGATFALLLPASRICPPAGQGA